MKSLIYTIMVAMGAVMASCSGTGGSKTAEMSSNDTATVEKIKFVNMTEGVVKIDSAYMKNLTPAQKAKLDTLIKIGEGVLNVEANSEAELIEMIEKADIDSCRAFVELIKTMTQETGDAK